MTINEYQTLAMRTLNPALSRKDVLINGVMGLCGTLVRKEDDKLVLEQNGNLLELEMSAIAMVKLHFEF